jgi:Carboxypeptidase regulatory-like domain
MTFVRHMQRSLIAAATFGLLLPPATFAVEPSQAASIRDVALQQGGTLRGTVLSEQGRAAAGRTVTLVTGNKIVAQTQVRHDGSFAITGLRPGVYFVRSGGSQNVLRLWSEVAAPPSATQQLLLVNQTGQVVRGAHGGLLPQWDHPILVSGLLLGAGVIGGVIGYNLKDDDPAS